MMLFDEVGQSHGLVLNVEDVHLRPGSMEL